MVQRGYIVITSILKKSKNIDGYQLFFNILVILLIVGFIYFKEMSHIRIKESIKINENIDIASSDDVVDYYNKVLEVLPKYTKGKKLVLITGYINDDHNFSQPYAPIFPASMLVHM